MLIVLGLGATGATAWLNAARERAFQQLVAAGEDAIARDDLGMAIEAFSGAIALKPDSMLAHLRRGETYRRSGDLRAALRDLREAASLDPAATHPLEQLGDVLTALDRHDRAAEQYAAYLELDDRSARVLYKQAAALYRSGEPRRALEPLERAVTLSPAMSEAFYLRGLCLDSLGDATGAREALQRAVALAPGTAPAREALAAVLLGAGRSQPATEQLEALAALEPDRPERLVALGLAYASVHRTDLAVMALGRAAERFPDNVEVYTALGRVWLDAAAASGDRIALGKALEALRPAALRGTSAPALGLYGRALLLAGDPAAAVPPLRDAAGTLPVDPDTLLWLSQALDATGRRREARDALQQHVALLGGERPPVAVLRRLGDLSERIGDRPAALRWFRDAAAAAPDNAALAARIARLEARAR